MTKQKTSSAQFISDDGRVTDLDIIGDVEVCSFSEIVDPIPGELISLPVDPDMVAYVKIFNDAAEEARSK